MFINAIGKFVPAQRIDNSYFKEVNGLEADWILQRTGIRSRSRCSGEESIDSMALDAVQDAVGKLPYDVAETNLIVAAHYCAYDTVATVGHKVQRHLNITDAKVVYASSACSSFINGLEIVEGYFAMGKADKALLICSEQNSYYADETDPKSGHLWGDAAVAFFISKERVAPSDIEVLGVFTQGLGHIGKGPEGVRLRPKEDGITMPDGRDVFIYACKYMCHALSRLMEQTGRKVEDVKYLITHQANKRIVAQVAHLLGLPMERFLNNIEEYGNTGSASCALVLAENLDKFEKGDMAALMVFGGGYSCGSFLVRF